MSDPQQEHAFVIEHLAPRLAALRFELCPCHMSENYFWKVYFVLLHSRLNKQDAETLSNTQVRMAIKNASRVEQSAKRWLSIMAKDCSRFCKIMRLSEKGSESSDASESVVNKERKKITFADEAGEKLCHVRIFENNYLTTSLESDSEKQQVLVEYFQAQLLLVYLHSLLEFLAYAFLREILRVAEAFM